MSRIGKKEIVVPENVTVDVAADNTVTVKGPKGELTRQFSNYITIKQDGNVITCSRDGDEKVKRQLHGTTRAVLANMIEGCSKGFEKKLKIVGIGYRAAMKGNTLEMNLGYSHPVKVEIEEGVKVECSSPTDITVSGINKERVGEVAAQIRKWRKPEPYKGKGILYVGESIIRKEGKTAGKK